MEINLREERFRALSILADTSPRDRFEKVVPLSCCYDPARQAQKPVLRRGCEWMLVSTVRWIARLEFDGSDNVSLHHCSHLGCL